MINDRFKTYFSEHFFVGKDDEFREFLHALESPLPRSIRIRPDQEQNVRKHLEQDGWILTPTPIDRVFQLDRRADFDPFERRIGMSLDHLVGNFYIQELAAAHPVDLLADHRIHNEPFLILDMASSPGGKTTELSEYFPESFIVANEPTRERIPQLLQNLERMPSTNIAITLYDGQQWKKYDEIFDRILLDAPCSGEGTLYKGTDATKNWHLKSIKKIAHLQQKLLESAIHALKVGGEMVYSTCALNDIENEGVIDAVMSRYGNAIETSDAKKFWPHHDKTGGFFMIKIRKNASLPTEKTEILKGNSNTDIRPIHQNSLAGWHTIRDDIALFAHGDKVLAVTHADRLSDLMDRVYFMRFGEYIGDIHKRQFIPRARAYRSVLPESYDIVTIKDEKMLDEYLRGNTISAAGHDGYVLVRYHDQAIAIEARTDGIITNRFPHDWRRV